MEQSTTLGPSPVSSSLPTGPETSSMRLNSLANQTPQSPPTYDQVGFFQEDNGNYSSMRLMSMVALVSAIVFGALCIFNPGGGESSSGISITFGFLIAAFAPKAVQKFAEQKVSLPH